MQIYVYNKSTFVNQTELNSMVLACNTLIKTFCLAWEIHPVTITVLNNLQHKLQKVKYLVYIIDNSIIPAEVLAYHTELDQHIVSYVMAKTIIDAGGAVLYKDKNSYTVAAALFQEIAEIVVDPTVNIWWQLNNMYMVASEVCDPVKNNMVVMKVGNGGQTKEPVTVALSDFIYPAWFDPLAKAPNRFNYTKTLNKPFSMSSGGSVVLINTRTNTITYRYGKRVPQWQKLYKNVAVRTVIRKHHVDKQLVNLDRPIITEIDDIGER